LRTLCDLAHDVVSRRVVLQLALILSLLVLAFAVAAAVVAFEDKRAARRDATARQARLARLGEVDPLAPHRLRADG
jgi:hypothetical protein